MHQGKAMFDSPVSQTCHRENATEERCAQELCKRRKEIPTKKKLLRARTMRNRSKKHGCSALRCRVILQVLSTGCASLALRVRSRVIALTPQEELRLGVAAGVNNLWAVDQHDHLKYRFGLALHVRLDPFTGCIHNVYQIPMQIDEHGHSLERDDYHQDDRKLTPKNLEMDGQLEAGFLYFGGINNGRGPGAT
ncbi:hypothetical protein GGX14DRAFT_390207 [Mycena pura]|uniref:Uncharacterized protein n=1 Tax=Mycena pura TaxID=153505 RepID=A0AAD6VVW4_9AGAR|nr:hypothetical protein GGX14DRAFT_390207 [Mycena pura]